MDTTISDHAQRDDAPTRPPLVVDLDGTLLATDVLVESLFILAKKKPARLLLMPFWLLSGLAQFKRRIAKEAPPDAQVLPYHRDLLDFLMRQRQEGRSLVLATGADRIIANRVAEHLGCFDAVLASDGKVNLIGEAKRERLVAEFGLGGFDYAGNGHADARICHAARKIILVHPGARLRRALAAGPPVDLIFEPGSGAPAIYGNALRLSHWVKNALVFLPLIAAHRLFELGPFAQACGAFLAFSLCASSVYLLNDLFDLAEDRRHPRKRQRMLASGRLTLARALLLVPLLLLGAAGLAATLPPLFAAVLGFYFLLMLAYNLALRNLRYVDVATLGLGYTLRVLGGGAAAGIAISPWLLAFCFPFFAGLALLKRYADLAALRSMGGDGVHTHAYAVRDMGRLAALGCGSGYAAVLLLGVRGVLDHHLSARYELNWLVLAVLLFWVTYIWLMAGKGRILDDPVTFALADRVSRIASIVSAIAVLGAT